ncbi:chemotaxis protein CheB [Ramlibacter tataouinensis]|uniref:protein-glutamate methylesterase n=1 Tax=Ramlibacter tataouinensis (strain ATCC BAA-407 / DSM 14655 / LMG 21543 / TTB310) TaxID=365046 RepID=F5Y607_RAMTT|nr:chemotaxis protein CheB [Ramlibacter tataouinensis]AEG91511.1 protein-glutamate methylesterase (protein methylesterase)-like protein [Ramlibacter tataouinensis TTB310]
MTSAPVVVIGASFGGVNALLELAAALPPDFPAIVGVVLHVGSRASILPQLLSRRGPHPAVHPKDGEPPRPGVLYVAPPDHHLLLTPQAVRLNRGPRENYARPAIDPLFRSAALGWRERAIGVILTGDLDDGTAGLAAIKRCGGMAVVQDPQEAVGPSMPASALAHVQVDHCVRLAQLAPLLAKLVGQPARSPATVPQDLQREQALFEGNDPMDQLAHLGEPSLLTCPDCGGGLVELKGSQPLRYRCHTGHGFTARSLEAAQQEQADHALWSSLRSLQERRLLLLRLATVAEATGDVAQAQAGRRQAERLREQAEQLSRMIESADA